MTEDILVAPPEFKLYKDRGIYIGTFIGGPLTAGYLIAENYKRLGEKGKVWKTWVITVLCTILIFSVAILTPSSTRVPGYIFPLLYAAFTSFLVRRLQGDRIKAHARNHGEFYTTWRAVVVSLIFGAISLGIILLILTFADLTT